MTMRRPSTFLVFGATGGTGKHFILQALEEGHIVRALVRNPAKLSLQNPNLQVHQGSITDVPDLDNLVQGSDFVVSMLGDANMQRNAKVNTAFVEKLVQAMRRHRVKRFLYQAGGLSKPYNESLPLFLWLLRHASTTFAGQHADNEAVMEYLGKEAQDIEWIVHRSGIGSDGASKGTLERSSTKYSVATHKDCADYNFRIITDPSAFHTCDTSHYGER